MGVEIKQVEECKVCGNTKEMVVEISFLGMTELRTLKFQHCGGA